VFIGGAVVQWLRDGLQCHPGSGEVQALAESVPDRRRDVRAGLHRPGRALLEPDARGTIVGLTRGSTVAHIARAALESIAFQSAALLQAMAATRVASGGAR
jgi:glycerol kinase